MILIALDLSGVYKDHRLMQKEAAPYQSHWNKSGGRRELDRSSTGTSGELQGNFRETSGELQEKVVNIG